MHCGKIIVKGKVKWESDYYNIKRFLEKAKEWKYLGLNIKITELNWADLGWEWYSDFPITWKLMLRLGFISDILYKTYCCSQNKEKKKKNHPKSISTYDI